LFIELYWSALQNSPIHNADIPHFPPVKKTSESDGVLFKKRCNLSIKIWLPCGKPVDVKIPRVERYLMFW